MKSSLIVLIKFLFLFNKAPLYIAVQNEDVEIVRLLLQCENIDVNNQVVLNEFLIKLQKHLF